MKNTVFTTTVIGFTIIALILVVSISLVSYRILQNYHLNSQRKYLDEVKSSISLPINGYLKTGEDGELKNFVDSISNQVNYRITVIQPDGLVLADSENDPELMDNHQDRPEILTAFFSNVGEAIRYSVSVKKDMMYRAYPLFDDDREVMAILRVSVYLDQIESLLQDLRIKIFQVSLIFWFLSVVIIYLYTRQLTKPIKILTDAAKRIGDGDLNTRVLHRAKGDIGSLIATFNDMSGRIKKLIDELSYQKNALDTIVSSMKEGLFLIDKDGIIVRANNSFKELINKYHIEGKRYWEVIKQPELSVYISELNQEKRELTKEIMLNGSYYLAGGTYNEEGEQIILVHNISELRNIERIKKDIIANVSHELKSPLTAIKGFVETLENEVTAEGKEFLAIINRNITRLINIVNDLLTLSRLERGDNIVFEPLDISAVIENVSKVFHSKISSKGLDLEIDIEDKLPTMKADEFKMEQLLTNLLDNALQYTEKGSITVSAKKENGFLTIAVRDTGCGISDEEQKKIFERFYVVDKSRSRKYGGTGLGLAIVKHITLLHNGTVSVKSEKGKGSLFTINLPLR